MENHYKNMLIGGLLAIVLVMSVAFAAFSTNLTINGTSTISSNWCVGFDSSKTSAYTATTGVSGATAPTATMAYSGTACATSYKPTATLSATFTQPGDKIVYTLTIANKGSLAATLGSVKVDGVTKTSTFTTTKGNIKFTVGMPASSSIAASTGTTTMQITAEFQNTTNIAVYTTAETQSIEVELLASQA